ncbi:ankyrin repeat-containing domain protein [Aspergillus crustosus]
MRLLDLPNDILLLIGDQVPSETDLSSLTKTTRRLYCTLSDFLHQNNIRHFNSSALLWAARHGRADIVKRMVSLNANLNAQENGRPAINHAAASGHADIVRVLLDSGSRYRYRRGEPWTPLCAAAAEGHQDIVRMLLQRDEIATGDQRTPIEPRSRSGSVSNTQDMGCMMIEYLFSSTDASARHHEVEYASPLFMAIAGGHDSTAEEVLEHAVFDLNYRDRDGRTALMWAISHGRRKLITSLLDHGADANVRVPGGESILCDALRRRNEDIICSLLAHHSVDVNLPDLQGKRPFQQVLEMKSAAALVAILKRTDLDLSHTISEALDVYQDALRNGKIDILDALLTHHLHATLTPSTTPNPKPYQQNSTPLTKPAALSSPTPNITDHKGRGPHSHAAEAGRVTELTHLLATNEVHLDDPDTQGHTPLFWAVKAGEIAMTRFLLRCGADVGLLDVYGRSVLFYATRVVGSGILGFGEKSGQMFCGDGEPDGDGPILLSRSKSGSGSEAGSGAGSGAGALEDTRSVREALVKLLLHYGVDVAVRDWEGRTALDWAELGIGKALGRMRGLWNC